MLVLASGVQGVPMAMKGGSWWFPCPGVGVRVSCCWGPTHPSSRLRGPPKSLGIARSVPKPSAALLWPCPALLVLKVARKSTS